jgi:hypothetical protein
MAPTQPPIQWVRVGRSPVIERMDREADHSPPPGVKVENDGAIRPLPIRLHCVVFNYLSTVTNLHFSLAVAVGIE